MNAGDVPANTTSSGVGNGLSSSEAAERLERDGPNALPVTPPPPAWRLLAGGSATRLASIAQLTRAGPRPSTPLAQELDRVVRTIALIAVGVGSVFFIVSLLVGTPASNGFLFAIGVTVALVPEGLLPTVTLSLAMGAQRMAARHALVRRLDSVETLGSTTFICTDKTGTLTRNEMSVVEAWTPAGRAQISGTGHEPTGSVEAGEESLSLLRSVARAAVRCSTGRVAQKEGRWIARGDPMEAALDVFARRLGIDVEADEGSVPVTKRFPFDPCRRRMSMVVGDRLFVKGAPDSVCPRCLETKGAQEVLQAMTERGLRVIAVASRPAHGSASEAEATETELELLGLIGLEDPPRPHAAESVAACRETGIRVAMITGDHPATAEAIARDRPYRAGLHGPPGARTHWGRVGDENLSFVDTPPDSGVSARTTRPASQVMDHSSLHSSCDRAQLPNAWIMTSLAPFAFSFTRCWWCNASTPGHAPRSARPGQLSIGSTERTTCMPAAS